MCELAQRCLAYVTVHFMLSTSSPSLVNPGTDLCNAIPWLRFTSKSWVQKTLVGVGQVVSAASPDVPVLLQVRALAAVYGLEPRACGRRGQTLFRTDNAGLPSADGQAQVHAQALCRCSPSLPHPHVTRIPSLEDTGTLADRGTTKVEGSTPRDAAFMLAGEEASGLQFSGRKAQHNREI